MPLSSPLLPMKFVKEVQTSEVMRGYSSAAFEKDMHERRLSMRSWTNPHSPDCGLANKNIPGFSPEANRTYLHLHAHEGDVIALCELIGLGATVDYTGTAVGQTPLQVAFQEMSAMRILRTQMLRTVGAAGGKNMENSFNRLAWCARILIEQHADVNKTVNGVSLVDLSCDWNDWTTLTTLLKHGARPSNSQLRKTAVKAHLAKFTKLHGHADESRPPRICPCWSGLTVANCHGREDKDYPLQYVCPCGSNKIYQHCCHKRGSHFIETWDTSGGPGRIIPEYAERRAGLQVVKNVATTFTQMFDIEMPEMTGGKAAREQYIARLVSKGEIDVAFAYALTRADFTPR